VEIRRLSPRDSVDAEAELDLSHRAFGPSDGSQAWLTEVRAAVSDGRHLAAYDGPQMVGAAMFHDMRQWWHGRPLRMAGVGGVKVAPEQRGRGTGRALMTGLLEMISAAGYPLSVLYPATAPLYRSLGWELAGGLYRASLPARSLAALAPGDGSRPDLRRAGPDDAGEVLGVLGAVHASARHCGPATFDDGTVARLMLADPNLFCYLAPDGFLAYGWGPGRGEMLVRCAVAGSAATVRAFWSLVGSHVSRVDRVAASVPPSEPLDFMTREPDLELARRWAWMLRVVDAPAAIAGRGFPAAVRLEVALQLDDPQLPANAGLWTLEVGGGKGTLTPSSPPASPAGPVRVGAGGFAALYGGTPMATLRQAGLAAGGGPADDEALDAAFAGPAFMLHEF
jgi:predicted acetyltransferase